MTKTYETPSGFEFDFEQTKETVCKKTSTAVKKIPAHLNGLYMLIASLCVALLVYMSVGIFAAVQRGFNGGVGGEVILAAAVFVGLRIFWHKIKTKLK